MLDHSPAVRPDVKPANMPSLWASYEWFSEDGISRDPKPKTGSKGHEQTLVAFATASVSIAA